MKKTPSTANPVAPDNIAAMRLRLHSIESVPSRIMLAANGLEGLAEILEKGGEIPPGMGAAIDSIADHIFQLSDQMAGEIDWIASVYNGTDEGAANGINS